MGPQAPSRRPVRTREGSLEQRLPVTAPPPSPPPVLGSRRSSSAPAAGVPENKPPRAVIKSPHFAQGNKAGNKPSRAGRPSEAPQSGRAARSGFALCSLQAARRGRGAAGREAGRPFAAVPERRRRLPPSFLPAFSLPDAALRPQPREAAGSPQPPGHEADPGHTTRGPRRAKGKRGAASPPCSPWKGTRDGHRTGPLSSPRRPPARR